MSPPTTAIGGSTSRLFIVGVAALLAVTAIAFSPALHGTQLFDDWKAIQANPSITTLWPITTPLDPPAGSAVTGRPVVNLTLAVNNAINQVLGLPGGGGTDTPFNTTGFHVVNLLIHIACGLLLLGIIRRTLRSGRLGEHWSTRADSVALLVTALWLLHPLQTEAVDYLIQRTELLVGLFYLGTLYCSIRAWDAADTTSRNRWFLAGTAACALGMGSKEVMCSAPFLVALYDRAFRLNAWHDLRSPAMKSRRWFYVSLAATLLLLAALLATSPRGVSAGFTLGIPWYEYLHSQGWAIAHYLRLVIWPSGLSLDYGAAPIAHWHGVPGLVLLVTLGVVTVLAWTRIPRWGWLAFLGTWFFAILAPSSSVVPVVTEIAAERRMYLPLAAVITVVVLVGDFLLRRLGRRANGTATAGVARPVAPALIGMACCGMLAALTWSRSHLYQDPEAIWRDAVAKHPANARAWYNLGVMVSNRAAGPSAEAEGDFRAAIARDSTYADALIRLAVSESARHEYADAQRHLRQIPLTSGNDSVLANLGDALVTSGDTAGALLVFGRVVEEHPTPAALERLGVLYGAIGQSADAATLFKRAVAGAPERTDLMAFLGGMLIEQHRPEEARPYLAEVARRQPASGVAIAMLAVADADLGKVAEAEQEARHAMELGQSDAHTCFFAGRAMLHAHRNELADTYLTRAVALDPQASDPMTELGQAEMSLGETADAMAHFKQALAINPNDSVAKAQLGRRHY